MITTFRAIAGRFRLAASKHTLATGLSVSLAAAVAGIGGGYALADHANAGPVSQAPAANPTPPPAPSTGAKHKGNAAAKKLVDLVAKQIGQTPGQVIAALQGGQTLNQVAGAKAAAVVQAAEALAKTKLDAMVSAGKLTAAQEAPRLARMAGQITKMMAEPGPRLVASLPGKSQQGATASPTPTP